jgi:hypothetical protein
MTATAFVDTNVLLYAASNASADGAKRIIARQVLAQEGIGFSAQVLQEFYSAAVTKERLRMTHDDATAVLESLASFPVCLFPANLFWRRLGRSSDFSFPTGMPPFSSLQCKWAVISSTAKISITVAVTTAYWF